MGTVELLGLGFGIGVFCYGCLIFGYWRGYQTGRSDAYQDGYLAGSETAKFHSRSVER